MRRTPDVLSDALRAFGRGIDAGHAIRHGRVPSPDTRAATAPVAAGTPAVATTTAAVTATAGAPAPTRRPEPAVRERRAARPELRVVTDAPAGCR